MHLYVKLKWPKNKIILSHIRILEQGLMILICKRKKLWGFCMYVPSMQACIHMYVFKSILDRRGLQIIITTNLDAKF